MKGPQVAALTLGWLAVALSMAAIGSASIARVGVDTAESQPQVTVTRTVTVGKPATTPVAAPYIAAALYVPTPPVVVTVAVAQYAKPVTPARTTAATAAAPTSSAAPQAAPTSAGAVPVVGEPNVGVIAPGDATTTPTSPATTKPGKGSTKHPSGGKSTTASGTATVLAVSFATWHRPEGAIRAGCRGATLTYVDAKPSDGYEAAEQTSSIRSSVTFDGATQVSVRVTCSGGTPSFSILR